MAEAVPCGQARMAEVQGQSLARPAGRRDVTEELVTSSMWTAAIVEAAGIPNADVHLVIASSTAADAAGRPASALAFADRVEDLVPERG